MEESTSHASGSSDVSVDSASKSTDSSSRADSNVVDSPSASCSRDLHQAEPSAIPKSRSKSRPLRRSVALRSAPSFEWADDSERSLEEFPLLTGSSDALSLKSSKTEDNLSQACSSASEECSLAKNPSKADLHTFIVETLRNKPKERLPILKLERDFTNLISEPGKSVLTYEGMSSYYRMLVHRVAAYFDLEHNVDSSEKCVVVSKTSLSKKPEQSFQNYCSREYSDEELMALPKSILRRTNTSDDTPLSSRSLSSQSSGEEKEPLSQIIIPAADASNRQAGWPPRFHSDAPNSAQKKVPPTSSTGGGQSAFTKTGFAPPQHQQQSVLQQRQQQQYYVGGGKATAVPPTMFANQPACYDIPTLSYEQQMQQQSLENLHAASRARNENAMSSTPPQTLQQPQQFVFQPHQRPLPRYDETQVYNQPYCGSGIDGSGMQRVYVVQQGQPGVPQEFVQHVASIPNQFQDISGQFSTMDLTNKPPDVDNDGSGRPQPIHQQMYQQVPSQPQSPAAQQQQQQMNSALLAAAQQQQQQQQQQQFVLLQGDPLQSTLARSPASSMQFMATPHGSPYGQMISPQQYGPSYIQVDPTSYMRYPYQASSMLSQQRPPSPVILSGGYTGSSTSSVPTSPFHQTPPPHSISPPQIVQGPNPTGGLPRSSIPMQFAGSSTASGGVPPSPQHGIRSPTVGSPVGASMLPVVDNSNPTNPDKHIFQFSRPLPMDAVPAPAFQYQPSLNPSYHPLMQHPIQMMPPYNMAHIGMQQQRPYVTMVPVQHNPSVYPSNRRPYNANPFQGYRQMMAYPPGMVPIGNHFVALPRHRKSKSRKGHSRYSGSHGHPRREKEYGNILEAYDFDDTVTAQNMDELFAIIKDVGGHVTKVNSSREMRPTSEKDDSAALATALTTVLISFNNRDKAQEALKHFHHSKYKLRMYRKNSDSHNMHPNPTATMSGISATITSSTTTDSSTIEISTTSLVTCVDMTSGVSSLVDSCQSQDTQTEASTLGADQVVIPNESPTVVSRTGSLTQCINDNNNHQSDIKMDDATTITPSMTGTITTTK